MSKPYLFIITLTIATVFGLLQLVFLSSNDSNTGIPATNKFSYSDKNSPYEQIWINSRLPRWATKSEQFTKIEDSITPGERICYVHVGKAGGSSVGCSLGFQLHCTNTSQPMEGLLPQRTTRMFHADTYDCHDDSGFFLFVVRDPVKRIQSDFLYERPFSEVQLKNQFPEYYERRKHFYMDCKWRTMEEFVKYGLKKPKSDTCKARAYNALWGTKHYPCHFYFNYQFHLEGLPQNAKILVIRNEHLINDWNGVEEFIGGKKDIIPPNQTLAVMNKSQKDESDKYLSDESKQIVCRELCNEIVNYKKILKRALNLNKDDLRETLEELRQQCPEYADVKEGECPFPMPDIAEKLVNSRGYEFVVMEGSYSHNAKTLETEMHVEKKIEDTSVGEDEGDDDGYQLPPYNH